LVTNKTPKDKELLFSKVTAIPAVLGIPRLDTAMLAAVAGAC